MNVRNFWLVLGLGLAGCANGIAGLRPLTYREPAETRVFVSESNCPSLQGRNLAPILATLAMGAASKLLEGFGNALVRAGEGGALPSSIATANFEIARGTTPKCLIIVRGAFAPTERSRNPVTLPAIAFVTHALNQQQQFAETPVRLPPIYELHHYIELQILGSIDGSALSFAPVYAHFERSMDGGTSGQREISIAVKFDRPGRPTTGSVLLIGPRPLGEVHRFGPQSETQRYPYEAAWFSSFHTAASPAAAGAIAGTPPAADGAGASSLPIPVTVTTTVIETRPTREFLAFVGAVFNGARPSIEGALRSEIDPATRSTEQRSAYEAQASYATNLASAHNAVAAYCTLDSASSTADRYTKSGAARSAQLTANRAAILADIDEPFNSSRLVLVSGALVNTVNQGPCGSG